MRLIPLTRRGLLSLPAALALPRGTAAQPGPGRFASIAYHEIGEDGRERHYSISESMLVQHLSFLRQDGWRFVSLDDVFAARDGRRPLPAKAMLLSFDDGYNDYYTRAMPVLTAFRAPAVFALVTSWMETPASGTFDYGGQATPRSALISWAQAREMQAGGLCEFASHSHDLHHGVRANPQGNVQPAAVTRIYDERTGRYETDAEWTRRIEGDLARSTAILARHLGRRPRSIVWPYGRHNLETVAIARRLGMPATLTLEPGPADVSRPDRINRLLTMSDPRVPDLARLVRFDEPVRERVLHVDLDHVYDPDPAQSARNLDALVSRVFRLGPSHVYLQAYADPDGDGVAEAVYFPNRHLPMRADLFNRVAWQLMTRAEVQVFAWMPVLAFKVGEERDLVLSTRHGAPARDAEHYWRLSPFAPRTRAVVGDIYEDLAKHASFDGLLFHDDAFLTDHEDANPAALAAYRAAGLPGDVAAIRADPAAMARWTALKSRVLTDLTLHLADRARRWRTPLKTARNLYARTVLEPRSEEWFAQSLPGFLAAYDRAALMAMPYMEQAPDADAFFRELFARVAATPGGIEKTVFELQAVDWRHQPARPIPATRLRSQLRLLQRLGAHHMGWYPDDFIQGLPDADTVRDAINARSFPFRR
jgi:poly-beta-1,6-N-acetyl-D-glucosamine N-deacetylase